MNEPSIPAYFGEGGRLARSAAGALIDSAYKHDCADADVLLPGLHDADLAHAIALTECGVIPADVAPALLRGLLELKAIPFAEFPIRPELGDVYNSKEALLKERLGAVAGWIHAGRPRREAVNVAFLLAVRDRVLTLAESLLGFARDALALATRHRSTLMPDFTYLQHAHPTVFGHYLLTFVYPAFRDFERLRHCFQLANTSVAGSGSVNGTRLPLDRARLAALLGCGGIATHTRDAMWQPDVPIEAMAAVVALLVNVNRLGEELQVWCTAEFDAVDFADELARASVIMPQKKNPYGLAWIRGLTGSLLGRLASVAAVGKTYSGNPDSRVFVYGEVPRALDRAAEAMRLLSATLTGIELNEPLLRSRATEGFSQATDLADVIMTARGLDYRTAHQIVGRLVRTTLENGIASTDITGAMLDEAASAVTGSPLHLTPDQLASALDPAGIVASRRGLGGASPESLDSMFTECREHLAREGEWIASTRAQLAASEAALLSLAQQIATRA